MLRYIRISVLAAVTLLAATFAANAQPQSQTDKAALLYRISGKNLSKPSYIFGTIHLMCPADMFPADKLNGYLGQTEQLMLELNLKDPVVLQQMTQGSTIANGKSVKDYLKPEDYAKVDAVFKEYLGISYDLVATFKPTLVTALLLRSPKALGCAGPQPYDSVLADAAVNKKITVLGLETVQDELAAIDSQPIEKQVEGLRHMAEHPETTIDSFKALYKVYLSQDSDELYKMANRETSKDAHYQTKLLTDRNAAWIPVIEKNIALKPTFIAVGSAHLGGKTGVLQLLRKKGYTLTPIRL